MLRFSTFFMVFGNIIPSAIREAIGDWLHGLFSRIFFDSEFTFNIEDTWQHFHNETYRAVGVYLPTRIGPSTASLVIGHNDHNDIMAPVQPAIAVGSTIVDHFQGHRFEWVLCEKNENPGSFNSRKKRWYKLKCRKKNREFVTETYIPHVCRAADEIIKERDGLSIFTYNKDDAYWDATVFKHPSTFETLAMDPAQKQEIISDLDLFVQRKDFFRSVGRAWKRGYLLYGPPGTGKSSLVAAIANHLKFNVYDLQLQSVKSDSDLRTVLTATTNRSILLLEDVDCSSKSTETKLSKEEEDKHKDKHKQRDEKKSSINPGVTLSGLLNFIDGLWSTCGDERIIILTTNHKEKLDPALLRPGRMDVHIHMGYCSFAGFVLLADKYLGVKEHSLFKVIEAWMQKVAVTPAEVAQQLMKTNDAQVALDGLIQFCKNKEKEKAEAAAAAAKAPVVTAELQAEEVSKKSEATATEKDISSQSESQSGDSSSSSSSSSSDDDDED
ncbi:unnamed protein product [Linum tenue]|uniref:AAA+ ATPase domain-containing protein n=1 Tax=Linum tenue TaxID=586396 RepID=A0AAV0Q6S5_9ROSI|nr:unnamed protein product [Linum tenue]